MLKDMTDFATDAARWEAVLAHMPAADGQFWYSVRTTGVYCRPSCKARLPLRRNVAFHDSREAAEAAGFRACKRCRPNEADRMAVAVARACRRIAAALEDGDPAPGLADLAEDAGFSPFHFHRGFAAVMGVTPRAYAAGLRGQRVRAALAAQASVTEAIYDAGYQSAGRFYAEAGQTLGMRPAAARDGGRGEVIDYAVRISALGPMLVAFTARGVCAIEFADEPDALPAMLRDRFPAARLQPAEARFAELIEAVLHLVAAPGRAAADLPLDLRGTAFQLRVWAALRQIPPGGTRSYGELAAAIGAPGAARAVAGACAANKLAVAVPCHRVIGRTGAVSGYRWGVARKEKLLREEAQ